MSTLKMVLHFEKTLKTTIKKNLSKSQKFVRKISVVEFCYYEIIFLCFTVILLMILKLKILWNFILKLYLRSWSLLHINCTYCILTWNYSSMILISVWPNFLYSNRLIDFSDIFHYFCENKIPKLKIKRLNQYIKLD